MARGWESKSVEEQIDMAESRRAKAAETKRTAAELVEIRKRESLILSRTRIVRELETVQSPRYKDVLIKALADLDAQLAALTAE
jgi:hypothetical protein